MMQMMFIFPSMMNAGEFQFSMMSKTIVTSRVIELCNCLRETK